MNEELRNELENHWSSYFYRGIFTKIPEKLFKKIIKEI
jgi:hypothetical protein